MFYSHKVKTTSVYIHWPFCPYRCHFCPFVALASHDHFMKRYHDALVKEIAFFGQRLHGKILLETLFLGGGTPSTYPDDLLLDMFDKLKGTFDIDDDTEVTIEVNPGTVQEHQLEEWKALGINRLSIGVQSLNNLVLKSLNRLQSAQDVRGLLHNAVRTFDNISVDLILGLPGVGTSEWKELLKEVVSWPLKHVSIYFLTIHENTRLFFDIQQQKVMLPVDDSLVRLYHWSVDFLKRYGFEHYETSNFARPGYQCRHNIVCWERRPYRGFGLGACSFDGASRFQNYKRLMTYLEKAEIKESCMEFSEKLTGEQIHLEKVMLGLRRRSGVSVDELIEMLSPQERGRFKDNVRWLRHNDYIQENSGRLVLTPKGLVVQNEVVAKLSV